MFSVGDGENIPTRYELLSRVKKNSNLTEIPAIGEEGASDFETNSQFWHDAMDLYFICGKDSSRHHDDDLIFFVRKLNFNEYGSTYNKEDGPPYFVRRWAPKLDQLVGENSVFVDWRRSFYLNLIAHTSFTVTVAICSQQVIRCRQTEKSSPIPSIHKVVKTVYASPSRVNFQFDSKKEVEMTPAYPDICFAVDEFDSTFDAMVMTETDHCYCVLLNAHEGASFPSKSSPDESSSVDISSLRIDSGSEIGNNAKLTLFSGFVGYKMVRKAYAVGKSRFNQFPSIGNFTEKTNKIYMKGPTGRGEVEVAVSNMSDHSQLKFKTGSGIGSIIHNAASVASIAAKHAYVAAASRNSDDDILPPLKCCLISISLPWEHIAYDLLFKGRPPVNL